VRTTSVVVSLDKICISVVTIGSGAVVLLPSDRLGVIVIAKGEINVFNTIQLYLNINVDMKNLDWM
jgi:hypothetical protein